jgi:hypothetical protein
VNRLRTVANTLLELFVDDRFLALGIACWIAAIAASETIPAGTPEARSIALCGGLIAILLASVVRGSQPKR